MSGPFAICEEIWANVAASRPLILARALQQEPVLTPTLLEQREFQAVALVLLQDAVPEQVLTRGERQERDAERHESQLLEPGLVAIPASEQVLTRFEPLEPDGPLCGSQAEQRERAATLAVEL